MSSGMYFAGQLPLRLRCDCCRREKKRKNGDKRCNGCIWRGCKQNPWGGYKRKPGCAFLHRMSHSTSRSSATRAWTEREKAARAARR